MGTHDARPRRSANAARIARRLGRRLKELRTRDGMTQAAFADALGITAAAVKAMEAGRQPVPAARLMQFAKVLGVPLLQLFAGAPRVNLVRDETGGDTPSGREVLDFMQACLQLPAESDFKERLVQALAIASDPE